MKDYPPLSEREEYIGKLIVAAAFAIHKAIGPGLLERVYEVCFCHELTKSGLAFARQVIVPIVYDGLHFNEGLRLDVFVENLVIVELKVVDMMNTVYQAQVLSYLKLTNKRLGYLINFNVPVIKHGIQRLAR